MKGKIGAGTYCGDVRALVMFMWAVEKTQRHWDLSLSLVEDILEDIKPPDEMRVFAVDYATMTICSASGRIRKERRVL